MNHVDKKSGFTLVELMLAMGFMSALLLAIAMTVIQIGNIYNRGITLKSVNQAGSAIANELQKSIASSASFDLSRNFKEQGPSSDRSGGRLCTGQYTYIWNYGVSINPTPPLPRADTRNIYTVATNPTDKEISLIKIYNPDISYCTSPARTIDLLQAVELLDINDNNLAIHSFNISSPTSATDTVTGQSLYNIEFLLGTNDQTALASDKASCLSPDMVESNLSFCSVARFNIVARAGNAIE